MKTLLTGLFGLYWENIGLVLFLQLANKELDQYFPSMDLTLVQ